MTITALRAISNASNISVRTARRLPNQHLHRITKHSQLQRLNVKFPQRVNKRNFEIGIHIYLRSSCRIGCKCLDVECSPQSPFQRLKKDFCFSLCASYLRGILVSFPVDVVLYRPRRQLKSVDVAGQIGGYKTHLSFFLCITFALLLANLLFQ